MSKKAIRTSRKRASRMCAALVEAAYASGYDAGRKSAQADCDRRLVAQISPTEYGDVWLQKPPEKPWIQVACFPRGEALYDSIKSLEPACRQAILDNCVPPRTER